MSMHILLFFLLFCHTFALYEDQIGKFDWRQQYIGNVEYHTSQYSSNYPYLYLTSTSHVLGAVDKHNGSLIWRQVLEEEGKFLSIGRCGKYLFTLSLRFGPLLRAWSPKTGQLHAEIALKSASTEGFLSCDAQKTNLFVLLTDKVVKVAVNRLVISGEMTFPSALLHNSKLIASHAEDDVLTAAISSTLPTDSLTLLKWDTRSGNDSDIDFTSSTVPAPSRVNLQKCISLESAFVCLGESPSNISQLLSVELKSSHTWSTLDLQYRPLDLKIISGKIFLEYPNERIEAFTLENNTNKLKSVYSLERVTSFTGFGSQVICLKQLSDKSFNNLQITSYDIQSGSKVAGHFPQFLNLSRNHGAVKKIDVLVGEGGLLVFTEEHAIQLISMEGEQLWLREEALADITAVEMIDLPVSAQEATIQEEFGQSDASVLELFINRIRSQVHQISVAFNSWRNGKTSSSSSSIDNEFTPLLRDDYNLHKMLVIVTSVGKIFGMESSRGRIMWEYYIPGTRLPANALSQHLFAQRSSGHFPLTAIVSVLLEESDSQSILLYLEPILGVPLNARTLKATANEAEAIVRLTLRVKLATLVPSSGTLEFASGSGEVEAANHVQPLCVISDDLKVQFMPPVLSNANPRDLLPDQGLYVYALNAEPASVTGYQVAATETSGTSITAKPLWHMHLSSEDCPQHILHAAVHPPNEHVHSIGRILGDRNVLYKYVNPNLLAVMTGGVSAMEEGKPMVSLYLIDTVCGQIIHSVVHRRAAGPTSLVVSENWVLYSVYNQRSHRTEFTVMELFERKETTDNLVPSPWDIFISSFLPSHSSPLVTADNDKHRHFSSLIRAANSAHGPTNESVLIPDILQRAFILASPLRSGALAVSLTERGITAKSLLFGLEAGSLLELPKSLLDPRRTLDVTPELHEEGLEPYVPELPISTLAIISYNQTLERIQRIHTAPSGLESTSLVFAHGLDLFFTHIAPSKMYDMLRDDFDYWFIATIVIGMGVASYLAKRFAARKELAKAWR
ncbi:hypothetical protein Aperf_G00000057648 [Anoplocephala perfoliata]